MPPEILHPRHFLPASKWDDWLADQLTLVFGSTWTMAVFLVVPLLALLLPTETQQVVFFLASGWIQLWALPLLNYAQNKAEIVRSAKADADHQSLVALHTAIQEIHTKIDDLTAGR